MAHSFIELHDFIESAALRKRVQYAVWVAAVNVLAENAGTANHAARLEWANKALRGPMDPDNIRRIEIRVLANATIAVNGIDYAGVDSDIAFIVAALVDELA